jgi:hypothetical protein
MPSANPNDARARAKRDQRTLPPIEREQFDPAAANAQKLETLRMTGLRRRARARGYELRHSDYGYSLTDKARHRVGDRTDLALDEVAAYLDAPDAG